MSATAEANLYASYFGKERCGSVYVEGGQNPVNTMVISGLPPRYAPLYEQLLRSTLKDYIKTDVQFTWKDIDAYLTFGTSSVYGGSSYGSTQTPIDVYLCQAYSIRHVGIHVPKIRPHVAERLLTSLGYDETESGDAKNENVSVVGKSAATYRVITKERLPRQTLPEQSNFRGIISRWHEDDVFTLFIQLASRAESFKTLCSEIANQLGVAGLKPVQIEQPEPDLVVLVCGPDENVYRGRVIDVHRKRGRVEYFTVFLIDDGAKIQVTEVYELPRSMLLCNDEAPFAYKAQLARVQSPDGQLVRPKSRYHLLRGRPCRVERFSTVGDVLRIDLFVLNHDGEEVNVNERLLHDDLAIRMSESDFSRDIHERAGGTIGAKTNATPIDPQSVVIQGQGQVDVDDREAQKLSLHGPRSPLCEKLQLRSLKRKGSSEKHVEITNDSVNQVMFGSTGSNLRFVVAHAQRLSQDKSVLQLMRTTVVPDINLMLPFVALVFAPRAEYRLNRKGTAYIGAICGLGDRKHAESTRRQQKEPAFGGPNDDLEVQFSHEMTARDAHLINRIRRLLGETFGGKSDIFEWSELPVLKIQSKLQDATLAFFKTKDRKLREMVGRRSTPRQSHTWETPTIEQQKEMDELPLRLTLFRPHPLRRLGTDACNEILSLLVDFKESAMDKGNNAVISLCPLCLEVFAHREKVKSHLISEEHSAREAKLTDRK